MCPLKHTDVKAEISGFISRVVVTQQFENPFNEKIEAVYTFPLPQNAAVDDMTMIVGERTVRGKILPREEAQAVYEAAKSSGQVASLLDQERPNIFTQSVANILPGEQIKITISYVETLNYVNGAYEFVFPMVVGPRYVPGSPTAESQGNGFAPDTDRVPDASRITPNRRRRHEKRPRHLARRHTRCRFDHRQHRFENTRHRHSTSRRSQRATASQRRRDDSQQRLRASLRRRGPGDSGCVVNTSLGKGRLLHADSSATRPRYGCKT